MASCPKCGKAKIRKRKDGRRKCGRCGFLNTVASMQMKYEVTRTSEIFTHVDHDTGVMRHFVISAMQDVAEKFGAAVTGIKCCRISIDEDHVQHLLKNAGIEPHRLQRLTPEYRDVPIIGVLWADKSFSVVDGNHRYVRCYNDGLKSINCYVFQHPFWEQFLADFQVDKEKMLDWMKTGFSGIGSAEQVSA